MLSDARKTAIKKSLPGMLLTGITGGVIGSFMGGLLAVGIMTLFGAAIGSVVWMLDGQHFFVLVLVGILSGSALAIYISGMGAALLGAGAGGAMGGFIAVNIRMMNS